MNKIWIFLSLFVGLNVYAVLPNQSIYLVKSEWKNQDNQILQLNSFSGKPTIIGMIYTMCTHTCPLTIEKLQTIEKKLMEKGVSNYQILLASLDPKNDKPARLKAYMKSKNLTSPKWTLVSSNKISSIRELSILLEINYKKVSDREYSHSNAITLLDKNGVYVDHLLGFNSSIDTFVENVASHAK